MKTDTTDRSIVTTIRLPLPLRGQLDQLRLDRAERGCRMPSLRDLVLEAINLLVKQELQLAKAVR